MIAFLSSDHFAHSKAAALNTVRKAQAKRAEAGPIPEEWDIEDHLTALNARISPLKAIGMDLLDVASEFTEPYGQDPRLRLQLKNCPGVCRGPRPGSESGDPQQLVPELIKH